MDNGDGIAGKGELLSVRFAKSVVPEQAGTHLPPHDWIAKGEMSNRGTCLSSTRLRGDDEGNYDRFGWLVDRLLSANASGKAAHQLSSKGIGDGLCVTGDSRGNITPEKL